MSETSERELREYARRVLEEVPVLIRRGIERGRVTQVDTERIAQGILAHAGTLRSLEAALADAASPDAEWLRSQEAVDVLLRAYNGWPADHPLDSTHRFDDRWGALSKARDALLDAWHQKDGQRG